MTPLAKGSKLFSMKIILLRHGTRNYGIGDIPLNEEGLQEAEELVTQLLPHDIKAIFSSPKLRCQMTVTPIANRLGLEIQTMEELDQHLPNEEFADYRKRVQVAANKLEDFSQAEGAILACSHSDWLAQAMELVPSDISNPENIFFQCAEFLVFQIKEGQWHKI